MVLGWDFSGLFGLMLGLYGCFFLKVSVVLGWDFSGLFGLMLGLYGCFFF